MSTHHRRISVTKDPELAEALARVAHYFPHTPTAQIVRDLALKGAETVQHEQCARAATIERLISLFTEPNETVEIDVLEHIDELAWTR
jgi:hypothetical protein